ncbi:signal recognition particle protein [Winkia sp. UMB0889B]|nr:signal recognition particle protein [Winkia sp. UMB0889B]MDK7906125.1 signal recognition particle protein [Winkia sp. UMB0889B]
MFNSLSDRLTNAFQSLRGKGVLSEADVDKTTSEIRRALLEADVALPVVREFISNVREKAYGVSKSRSLNPGQQVIKIVNEELIQILGGEARDLHEADRGPTVYMLAGLQGAGKTTLAGKLGKWLTEQGKRVLLVACDLQRPNAVNQLQVVGKRAGVEVWAPNPGNGVGDPVETARSGVNHAILNGYDMVIVDTAGRLGVDEEMMSQARAIKYAVEPHETLFVLDAMIGQDAVTTAEAFRDGVGFTGVVLTKLDGDARGGAALSVRGVTGEPILFASTGEGLTDFERFHPDRMASRILDMGDVLTLIETAEKAFDEREAEDMAKKLAKGNFTFNDFLAQMQQMRKLGSLKKIMGMMPGIGQYREALENFDEKEINRIEAIVRSMTPAEREDASIIRASRRKRIAAGSGVTVAEVNGLLKRFEAARKMMQQATRSGQIPGMPGMPGMPGVGGGRAARRKAGKSKKKKRKSGSPARTNSVNKSGNPAKVQKQSKGSAFGAPTSAPAPQPKMPSVDELPYDLKRLLGGM